ncbi:MAG: MFS transporter [Legionellaceae bacterium]|nr:MFS transporter [Legionellaceae bacterium]
MQTKLPFFTLLLLISFASVNAVLFTPALPDITQFFAISEDLAQQTITWFLVGYALGQLLYGPIANRFGRKPALYAGIIIQILSSLLCALSGVIHMYWLLIVARFMLALGSGVGLKMTFTLVNECYDPKMASQKISYLMLAFAVTPGLGVALGGFLNTYLGWMSCFYASAIYGLVLLVLVTKIPETQKTLNLNALKIHHLIHDYALQFKNIRLVMGGLLMGTSSSVIYVFSALAPFIAISLFGMSSDEYGVANCLPPVGMILGSLVSARLSRKYSFITMIRFGIWIASAGVIVMFTVIWMHLPVLWSLFFPMVIIYFGLCFILANASASAMESVTDKAHGAAVMSFINMGFSTLVVFSLAMFPVKALLLPIIYLVLCVAMLGILKGFRSMVLAQ